MSSTSYDKVRERLVKYRSQKEEGEESSSKLNDKENVEDIPDSPDETTDKKPTEDQKVNSPLPEKIAKPTEARTSWIVITLKFLLWILLQWFFIEVEFGIAFFIASCFYFIYASLVGSRRKSTELSAYSVFNKNFERIDGTLTAEQFEREIRHGPAAVH